MSQRLGSRDPSGRREGQKLLRGGRKKNNMKKLTWRKVHIFKTFVPISSTTTKILLAEKLKVRNAGQLTDSRWFSSGSRLCNSLVPGHFRPHWMQYEMGLSAGQSSSLGKPITLTKVNTTGAENKPHGIVSSFEALTEFLRMRSNIKSKCFQT